MSHLQNCSLKIYLKRARGGGQGGCDLTIKVFGKVHTKKINFGGGGGGGGGVGLVGWGQGGCERRIEVFVKIQKKKIGGGGVG